MGALGLGLQGWPLPSGPASVLHPGAPPGLAQHRPSPAGHRELLGACRPGASPEAPLLSPG